MSSTPRCPSCRRFVYLDTLECPDCGTELGFQVLAPEFFGIANDRVAVDGVTWSSCSQREWGCNWLVREDAPAGRCFSCRLTRTRPASDDTITAPVQRKPAFVHEIITRAPLTTEEQVALALATPEERAWRASLRVRQRP